MDLVFLPVTYNLQLKFLKQFLKHLLDSYTIMDFYQTWTEALYNQKIVSRGKSLITFSSFLLSLQLTAQEGETLGSAEPLRSFYLK